MDQIKKTADVIKKIRPVYQPILDFYSQVFLAQEESRSHIELSSIIISSDLLAMKQESQLPLIDPSEFLIDMDETGVLFVKICDLARDLAPELSRGAQVLKGALQEKTFELETVITAILNNQDAVLEQQAGKSDVPVSELIFFTYSSMVPSLQACSEQLETYLPPLAEIKKGYCPICGNPPDMAFFDEDGKRHLKCSFCSHRWNVGRMGCVFCENNDKDQQLYFFSDEEKEYRVNLCDHCRQYIKVVDLRKMDRAFFPALELVSSLHLDIKARKKGYRNGSSMASDA
ncbi:formate dehydrogenase accessory protein FdhE [Desulfocicer vacuolatum]|nr:formate dehydrogenase accessory protein FdhE [Desulfocicer vacuolatum]